MHINELPPELLVLIFSKIDDFPQKIGLERVCRYWLQNVNLDWKTTKICRKPLINLEIVGLVLNRCGECLEELWLQNIQIDGKLIKRLAKRMKCLKHLKLSKCELDGPAMDSIGDLFGQQLNSFILDETTYHPIIRKLIENESSKLDHLSLNFSRTNYSIGTLPNKLPSNLKTFSLKNFHGNLNSLIILLNAARNCKNLKILHFEIHTLYPEIIRAIGNIKSLVYLNLDFDSIIDQFVLQNIICQELPNLKGINFGGYCLDEMLSNIARDRPDLIHLNVFTRPNIQISDSLNSLTLRAYNIDEQFRGIFPETLLFQGNKSLQHLDLASIVLPSNLIQKLLGQFPDLKILHCKMPATNTDFNLFFSLIEKHLKKGRNITIYLHIGNQAYNSTYSYKYTLPHDFSQFKKVGWRPNMCFEKCENLVLKKVIKEAINGGNEPSFLSEWWME